MERALTIRQPYASLIISGVKRFETRSWKTNRRGRIFIHAGLTPFTLREYYDVKIAELIKKKAGELPLTYGAILGVADIIGCWEIKTDRLNPDVNKRHDFIMVDGEDRHPYSDVIPELEFGNFSDGRYAWQLHNVVKFPEPIFCRGKQGLWDCQSELAAAYYLPSISDELKQALIPYVEGV